MHHLARVGYLKRAAERLRPTRRLPKAMSRSSRSWCPPMRTPRRAQTLFSAALQQAGPRRVVLLIDDPRPAPPTEALFVARREAGAVASPGRPGHPAAAAAAAFARRAGATGPTCGERQIAAVYRTRRSGSRSRRGRTGMAIMPTDSSPRPSSVSWGAG
jgi:hypothetical protein